MSQPGDRRQDRWHVGREIPIALIGALVISAAASVMGYYVTSQLFAQKVVNWMNTTQEEFNRIDERFRQVDREIERRTADRIHGATVREMFRTKDAEIDSLNAKIDSVHDTIKETNKLLHIILREMPRAEKGSNRNMGSGG